MTPMYWNKLSELAFSTAVKAPVTRTKGRDNFVEILEFQGGTKNHHTNSKSTRYHYDD